MNRSDDRYAQKSCDRAGECCGLVAMHVQHVRAQALKSAPDARQGVETDTSRKRKVVNRSSLNRTSIANFRIGVTRSVETQQLGVPPCCTQCRQEHREHAFDAIQPATRDRVQYHRSNFTICQVTAPCMA